MGLWTSGMKRSETGEMRMEDPYIVFHNFLSFLKNTCANLTDYNINVSYDIFDAPVVRFKVEGFDFFPNLFFANGMSFDKHVDIAIEQLMHYANMQLMIDSGINHVLNDLVNELKKAVLCGVRE